MNERDRFAEPDEVPREDFGRDVEDERYDDFDAFWAEQRRHTGGHQIKVFGELVTLPSELPMDVEWRLEAIRDLPAGEVRAEIEDLVGLLYGDGVLDRWRAHGITGQQFQVLLVYGMARASGREVSFEETLAEVARADQGGNVPFRTGRGRPDGPDRRSSATSSRSTGGRSRPTSSGSTGSTRHGSPR
ncbi:hypothetical protein ACGFNU_01865 [Spirillospora sp. NPDC048911]|uniref:hypothetical protein n=1 Tax=Spirillospora sp. NPDC048911 TaxID=3364527 RepID=UPI003714EC07